MHFITKLQLWLLLAIATWLSLTPKPGAVFEHFWDKSLHLVCWMVLFLSCRLAYGKIAAPDRDKAWAGGLFIYASCVEALQMLVPGRFFSVLDIVANGLGLLLGWLLWRLWIHISRDWLPGQSLNRWLGLA